MLAFLFINTPREYAIADAVLLVAGFIGFTLLCLIALRAYRETTGRPLRVPERVRPPREQPVDLAAERTAFELAREQREEDELLRRAS